MVTRYQDIVDIERNTEVFKNAPKSTISGGTQNGLRMIVVMDPPDHTVHRALAQSYFMPKKIEWVKRYAEEIVTEAFDKAMARNGEIIDLQDDIANQVPTAVISAFLGLPREMWPRIIEWTNQIINASDPRVSKDQSVLMTTMQAISEMCQFYTGIFEDRRQNPRDDLPTALVNARINGEPMGETELYSWAIILMTAGHETTQSTFGLGVHALMQHPEQLAKLKANPALLPSAIEEILRYVSPAIHFCRTPDRDIVVGGKQIRAGEHMVMFYPAGNRDPEVFANPDRVRYRTHTQSPPGLWHRPARLSRHASGAARTQGDVRTIPAARGKHRDRRRPERVYGIPTGGYKHFPVRMTIARRPDVISKSDVNRM